MRDRNEFDYLVVTADSGFFLKYLDMSKVLFYGKKISESSISELL